MKRNLPPAPRGPCPALTDGAWSLTDYDEDKVPDLVFIKTAGTSSKDVEVHVASGN